MTLESRLAAVLSAIGVDYKKHNTWITGSSTGDLTGLTTTAKTSLVAAINEVRSTGGTPGATGPKGDTGRGFNPRGAWAPNTLYNADDIFTANGSTHRAISSFTSGSNANPPASFNGNVVEVWASKGADGSGGGTSLTNPVQVIVQNADLSWPARSTLVGATATSTVQWLGKDGSPPADGGSGMLVNDLFFAIPA
jgi:hypothetical protein